jgi:hypothetical protein
VLKEGIQLFTGDCHEKRDIIEIPVHRRTCSAAGCAAFLAPLGICKLASQAPAQAADGNITTTLADQTDLALTVYNSNLSSCEMCASLPCRPGLAPAIHGHRLFD